jgi:hypothetical protein
MSAGRRIWIVAGIGVALIVVIGGAVILSFRDSATPATEEDAVAGLGTMVVGSDPGDPGLYTYRTTGFATTDALGGGRHDYPGESHMTLQPGGCGTIVRWIPLQERILEWEYCDGVPIPAGWQDFHRWFGVVDDSRFECGATLASLPSSGETWDVACSSDNTTKDDTWEIIGGETLVIDGDEVEVVHVRRLSESSGRTVGPLVSDIWFLEGTVLPVRMTLLSDTVTSSPIGDVEFHEEFTLDLVELSPRS